MMTVPELEKKLNELYEWAESEEVQRLVYHGPEIINNFEKRIKALEKRAKAERHLISPFSEGDKK